MTIRREVDRLAVEAQIIKVLDGVQNASTLSDFCEAQWGKALAVCSAEKQAIAREALEHIARV